MEGRNKLTLYILVIGQNCSPIHYHNCEKKIFEKGIYSAVHHQKNNTATVLAI